MSIVALEREVLRQFLTRLKRYVTNSCRCLENRNEFEAFAGGDGQVLALGPDVVVEKEFEHIV